MDHSASIWRTPGPVDRLGEGDAVGCRDAHFSPTLACVEQERVFQYRGVWLQYYDAW